MAAMGHHTGLIKKRGFKSVARQSVICLYTYAYAYFELKLPVHRQCTQRHTKTYVSLTIFHSFTA